MDRLRVGTWNCRGGIDRKHDAVDSLGCSVLVIPECASDPRLATRAGTSFEWMGQWPSKGLGVFGFDGWTVEPLDADPEPWCLPLSVKSPDGEPVFDLLAIWTIAGAGRPNYSQQFAATIARWSDRLISDRLIIAGDLNASFQTARRTKHPENVEELGRLGTVSTFHHCNDVAYGDNEPTTLRWVGPNGALSFHCDYVFASAALVPNLVACEVGTVDEWLDSGLSDHCPVVAALNITNGG